MLAHRPALGAVPPRQQVPAATPINTILAFAGITPPSGWQPCDGRKLNKTQFVSVFNAIGYAYGGTGTRGRFLRGVNAGAKDGERDPESRALGSLQSWATASPKLGFNVSEEGAHNHDADVGQRSDGCDSVHEKTDCTVGELNIRNGWALPTRGGHHHTISGGDAETKTCECGRELHNPRRT